MSDVEDSNLDLILNNSFIEDPNKRKVTLSKKKLIVIKKCIELAQMCRLDIFLCMFDKDK